jgi:hypothetical protein
MTRCVGRGPALAFLLVTDGLLGAGADPATYCIAADSRDRPVGLPKV